MGTYTDDHRSRLADRSAVPPDRLDREVTAVCNTSYDQGREKMSRMDTGKGVKAMQKSEQRVLDLFGKIAAVIEQGGYTYQEAHAALFKLSEHYRTEGQLFLDNASILDVAQYRQRLFEKNTAALDGSAAAKGQA